jgi:hypothetical protein
MRPAQLHFIRIVLLLLAVFFAHFLGRVIARLRRHKLPCTKAITWFLRTAVALFGIVWIRGFDLLSIVALVLCAAAVAAGMWIENRTRKVEEIHLFPDDDRMG